MVSADGARSGKERRLLFVASRGYRGRASTGLPFPETDRLDQDPWTSFLSKMRTGIRKISVRQPEHLIEANFGPTNASPLDDSN
jgi:hypothetical protein